MTPSIVMYETAACPWCGSTEALERYPALHVVDCARCGLRYASPQLTEAGRLALYSQGYFESEDSAALGYTNYDADRPQLLVTFDRRLREIERHTKGPGRLLDIGCATGICVQAAQDRGWEAEGIDLSAFAVNLGRERYGLRLHEVEAHTWANGEHLYDAVTMWDYLEHVPDPVGTIRAVTKLLRPGGLLILTVPDTGSLSARVFGGKWMGYKRDEHLTYFDVPAARALLRAGGLEPIYHHYVGKHIRFDFFLERLRAYAPHLSRVLLPLSRLLFLDHIVIYINPLDIVCLAARKPGNPG